MICFKCNSELIFESGSVGRRDSCNRCNADVRVCLNCTFYDKSSYNECKESSADRVVDKEKANFCDYFVLAGGKKREDLEKKSDLSKLNDLFK